MVTLEEYLQVGGCRLRLMESSSMLDFRISARKVQCGFRRANFSETPARTLMWSRDIYHPLILEWNPKRDEGWEFTIFC